MMRLRILWLCLIVCLVQGCDPQVESPSVMNEENLVEMEKPVQSESNHDLNEIVEKPPMIEDDYQIFQPEQYAETVFLRHLILNVGASPNTVGLTFVSDRTPLTVHLLENDQIVQSLETSVTTWRPEEEDLHSHRVTFDHLKPNTQYFFVVIEGKNRSEVMNFKSMSHQPKILFLGDIQGYKQSHYDGFSDLVQGALSTHGPFDFIYIAGDLVDTSTSFDQWQYFFQSIEAFNDQLFVTSVGNHDVYETDVLYQNAFNYPNNGLLWNRHFYFETDQAIFFQFDTEYFEGYSDQIQWMNLVSKSDKHQVVMMHRSMYPVMYDESYIRALSDDFQAMGIDLVISGHDHIYSRTRIKDGVLNPDDGIVYIVGGSGSGSKFYDQYEERAWLDVVYDEDLPVYTVIDFKDRIEIQAFALDEVIKEIDSIEIK